MAIESEVLVVGGGLAGITATLSAADEGADVRLVSAKQSTLRQASGLVDVLGYTPDGAGPIADPFEAMAALPDTHPYSRVGESTVREGFALFDAAVGDSYRGAHTDANALVPTHGGTIKPTARYPDSVAAGVASDGRDTLLVGFAGLTDFDAPVAAAHLRDAGVPFDVDGVTVEFPADLRADAKVTRFAQVLDEDRSTPDGSRDSAREALAATVDRHLEDHERVGFPAVLGDDHPAEIRESLERHLGVPVFEIPTGPPSLPGMRLADRLFDALDDAGVSIELGNPVVDFVADEDAVTAVEVDRTGARTPYSAEGFVLATGGLVGKGIDSDRDGVREPVFDLHVPHPEDRYDWFEEGAFDDHAFARFGVDVDDSLRPQSESGDTAFANLWAAGSVLGGYDFAAEKSGGGVSIATGYAAGRAAAEATQ